MTKETVVSFIFAVCVVGGSMFLFARASGGLPQALAAGDTPASQPVAACTDGGQAKCAPSVQVAPTAPAAKGGPAAPARAVAAMAQVQKIAEAAQARVDEPEDEAATPPVEGKPRCRAIGHQVLGIDGALTSPLSPAVRDYYTKQRRALLDEKATLAC